MQLCHTKTLTASLTVSSCVTIYTFYCSDSSSNVFYLVLVIHVLYLFVKHAHFYYNYFITSPFVCSKVFIPKINVGDFGSSDGLQRIAEHGGLPYKEYLFPCSRRRHSYNMIQLFPSGFQWWSNIICTA